MNQNVDFDPLGALKCMEVLILPSSSYALNFEWSLLALGKLISKVYAFVFKVIRMHVFSFSYISCKTIMI